MNQGKRSFVILEQADIKMKVEPFVNAQDRFPIENRKMLIDRIRKLVQENVKTKSNQPETMIIA